MEQVDHLVLYFYYTIIIFNCYRLYHTGGAYETNTFKRYYQPIHAYPHTMSTLQQLRGNGIAQLPEQRKGYRTQLQEK